MQPDYKRPAVELPEAWKQTALGAVQASAQNPARDGGWWRIYADPAFLHTRDLVPPLEHLRDEGAAGLADLLPCLGDDLRAYRVAEREPIAVPLGEATVRIQISS